MLMGYLDLNLIQYYVLSWRNSSKEDFKKKHLFDKMSF